MIDKQKKTEILSNKIKQIVIKSCKKGNLNKALAAISFMGDYLYNYNQYYSEDELEYYLCQISEKIEKKYNVNKNFSSTKKIIFYDGFGLDTRGVALMYLNALGLNKYDVVYVTKMDKQNIIPTIKNMCEKYGFKMRFVNTTKYIIWAKELIDIICDVKPETAFFYTTPSDVSGIVAFHIFKGKAKRYLIDLTDHAFWLGKSAADYFLGSRDMSASLQYFERGISKEQMIKLGVNLLIDSTVNHDGLPFNPLETEYIFSGGSLYKTLGDSQNTYYKIIENILSNHLKIKFLYAGSGDDKELKKLIKKYPNRVFHIEERKDFFYLIQNCILYINTYPMFGGMMMKYCGLAGKIPITLKHGNDSDGLLLNQKECQIEYSTYKELIEDVDKLLDDSSYRNDREKLLKDSVITEERFKNNIKGVIEKQKTDYEHQVKKLNTAEFRKEYYERFSYKNQMCSIARKEYLSLANEFPLEFLKGILYKVYKKIKKE